MKRSICLTGDPPENWAEAITELSDDLGMVADDCGIPVKVKQGEELAVISDGERVMLTWSEPVQFYRALSLIPELSVAALPYMRREDGSMGCVFTMGEIVSACKIDG